MFASVTAERKMSLRTVVAAPSFTERTRKKKSFWQTLKSRDHCGDLHVMVIAQATWGNMNREAQWIWIIFSHSEHNSFYHLLLWQYVAFPVRPKERTVDWNQKEERDTTGEWREQMSISSGLARKKKRLRDLFGRIWHLECINKQLFFFQVWEESCWGEMIQSRSPSTLRLL